jgi:hypothetical protein
VLERLVHDLLDPVGKDVVPESGFVGEIDEHPESM